MEDSVTQALADGLRRVLQQPAPDTALEEFGWREALATEGLSVAALLFAEQGAAGVASTALDDVLAAALDRPGGPETAVILPAYERTAAPSTDGAPIRGLGTARVARAATAIVVSDAGGRHRAVAIPTAELRCTPISGLDPRLGLATVDGEWPAGEAGDEVDWPRAVAAGQIALAYELIGASRTMLTLARDHALVRTQFDRPIAAFQAVRHRLAECLVAIEAAQAAADAAREAAESGGFPTSLAGMAKALAGRGARTVARHCQQVLAGIGFTAEHALHGYVRRVLTLDGLLGSARTLTVDLGQELLRTRQLPPALPL
jgi:hypothetical protein